MEPGDGQEEDAAEASDGHRIAWFAPERPVNGGTVFIRPDAGCVFGDAEPNEVARSL